MWTKGSSRALAASPWPAVAVAVVLGGGSPVLSKYLLRSLTLESLLVWRYTLSLLVLLPLVRWRPAGASAAAEGRARAPSPVAYLALACVAILGSGVGAVLFTSSLQYAPAAVSNALSKTGPLFVAFLAHLLLNESVSLGTVGLLVAMLLAAGLLGAGEATQPLTPAPIPLLGAGLAAAAGLSRAVAEVAAKSSLSVWPAVNVAAARFLGGAALAAAMGLFRPGTLGDTPASPHEWLVLLTLAWVCTALPIALYYWGMARLPVHMATGVRTSGAVVTALLSWAALGEGLNLLHLLGIAALLLAAYAMASLTPQARATVRRRRGPIRAMLELVTAVVAGSVLLAGLLQAWQLQALMQRQVHATLGRTAAIVGEVVGLGDSIPQAALHSFVQRVVSEQISTPGYAAEFAYIVVADAAGTPVAWAFREGDAWDATPAREKARALVRQGPAALGRLDLLPAHVAVSSDGRSVGDLYIGYRASIAWWPLLAVLARTGALAAVLALVTAAAVSGIVRSALGPLAAVAAHLREQAEGAVARAHEAPASSAGPAAGVISDWLRSGVVVLPYDERPRIVACARAPDDPADWLATAAANLAESEGRIVGAARGWLVVAWGAEEIEVDDPTWAYLWAVALPAGPRVLMLVEGNWAGLLDDLAKAEAYLEAPGAAPEASVILATPAYADLAGEHIEMRRIGEDLYEVRQELAQ